MARRGLGEVQSTVTAARNAMLRVTNSSKLEKDQGILARSKITSSKEDEVTNPRPALVPNRGRKKVGIREAQKIKVAFGEQDDEGNDSPGKDWKRVS
ncbi:hypothetical protein AAC387_Pa06g1746 [Persea americana]